MRITPNARKTAATFRGGENAYEICKNLAYQSGAKRQIAQARALASEQLQDTVTVGSVELTTDSPYAKTDENGNVTTAGASKDDYNIWYDVAQATLYLKNATIKTASGNGIEIRRSENFSIIYSGQNTIMGNAIAIHHDTGTYGIATLTIRGEGKTSGLLTLVGESHAIDCSNLILDNCNISASNKTATECIYPRGSQNSKISNTALKILSPAYGMTFFGGEGTGTIIENSDLTIDAGQVGMSANNNQLTIKNCSLNITGTASAAVMSQYGTIAFNGCTGTLNGGLAGVYAQCNSSPEAGNQNDDPNVIVQASKFTITAPYGMMVYGDVSCIENTELTFSNGSVDGIYAYKGGGYSADVAISNSKLFGRNCSNYVIYQPTAGTCTVTNSSIDGLGLHSGKSVMSVWSDYTLQKDFAPTANFVIENGACVTIPKGLTLTVKDGNTLTNKGVLINNGTLSGTVTDNGVVLTKPAANKGFVIDYAAGTATADSGYEISTDSTNFAAFCTGIPGKTLFVRAAYDKFHTDVTENVIPARPDAPNNLRGENETYAGDNDGKITGTSADMEYKLSTATDWTECTGSAVENLAAGTYLVRVKAREGSFASAAVTVEIKTGEQRTYTLNVTAPTFDTVTYGYQQPEAKALTIANSGNSDATIDSVTVDNNHFIIAGSGSTVTTGSALTTWTIQPVNGLDAGTYTGTVTVSYQDTETAAAQVSFMVSPAEQAPPDKAPEVYTSAQNSITLKEIPANSNGAAAEYSINGGASWQSSPVFAGLSSGTKYSFVVRYGAMDNYKASPASPEATFFTSSSSSGGNYSQPTYRPDIEQSENGEVSVSPQNPEKGDRVTITPKPDTGYAVEDIIVTDRSGNSVKVTDNGNGTFSFRQPDGRVTIEVTYRPVETAWKNIFKDVSEDDWFYEGVRYVHQNGLMAGTSADTFSPDMTTSRGMLVTILWRMAGNPTVNYTMDYTDVTEDAYYAEAVRWATAQGIVYGCGDKTFAPNAPVSREQMATILYNYAKSQGEGFKGNWMFRLNFSDAEQVSPWAYETMCWCNMKNIMNGTSVETLAPKGQATRAQVAVILMRFCETIK